MKKLLFLLACTVSFGQDTGKVAQTILEFQQKKVVFEKHSLFTPNNDANLNHDAIVSKATYATLDLSKLSNVMSRQPQWLEVEILYNNQMIPLLLYKVNLHADGFHIDTDKAQNIAINKSVHYRGIIKGDEHSLVSFNFFENQLNAIVSGNTFGNLVIGKLQTPKNATEYITYSDKDLLAQNNLRCNAPKSLQTYFPEITTQSQALTLNCVTIYFEIDYDLYLANGSDLSQTTTWINSVYNNVQTLFANDNINTALKSVFIWTSPDPYSGADIYQYLDSFHANRPVFDGDVGQLLTKGTNFGGVAAVVNGLCTTNNYLYSDVYFAFSDVPAYSWTVQSITHELGHIMGSPHTHDCVWNGNNTPIDGCGPSIGYPGLTQENTTCNQTAPNPASGTIMSYCYAVAGVGNNFANGFGSQPAARIQQTIDEATCLGADCINSCLASVVNLVASDVTFTSVTLSWTNPGNSTTAWEVAVAPYPFVPTTWTTYNSLNTVYLAENLQPNTYYRFFVRNICGTLIGASVATGVIATLDDFCDNKPFTDASGSANNYEDYQDFTRTIYPSLTGNALKVTFTSIDIEDGYDFLYVYNGTSINDPELQAGGITGNAIVGPFTSTHPSGALTFRFISDTNTNGAGWNATLSCQPLGIDKNDFVDFSYSPNPVKNTLNISSKNEIHSILVYSIDGKLLYQSNSTQINPKIEMSAYAKGTYIVKLQFETQTASFKIILQ